MPSELMITAANFLQSSIPLLSISAYLPQWKKLIATKSSKDISLRAWLIWAISSAIALFYAVVQYQITGQGEALMFSSLAIMIFVIITVYLVILYRKPSVIAGCGKTAQP